MLNQKVVDVLVWLYSFFDIKLLTFIAAGFTVYFGWQKVTRKVCVSYRVRRSALYEAHISDLVISNKRDNAISISLILCEIGNKGVLTLIEFDSPLVLKGYDSVKVDIPLHSMLHKGMERVKIDAFEHFSFSLVTTAGNKIDCLVESSVSIHSFQNCISKSTFRFNDIVLTEKMQFIFFYMKDKEERYCIFDYHNFINGDNPFPYSQMNQDELKYVLIEEGFHDWFDNYLLYSIDGHLSAHFVFSKNSIDIDCKKDNK
ncbi:TPA: hypothetical protein MYM88_001855 [Klebsiella pneumoniae]|uniref:hypothetical protein n=1 Tax=Klebsiella pneumoniae TaxID=573 RepID=UPI000A16D2E9|nr:hypothetical protein [Klebsiella pneumoniae]HCB0364097.1 hypothetical protein [Klebsiella pneumoniae]